MPADVSATPRHRLSLACLRTIAALMAVMFLSAAFLPRHALFPAAQAQDRAAPAGQGAAVPAQDRAQLQHLLNTLDDPQRRAAFLQDLHALQALPPGTGSGNAAGGAGKPAAASPPAAKPAASAPIALAPGSLGAVALHGLGGVAGAVVVHMRHFGALFADLRGVETWGRQMLAPGARRDGLVALGWQLGLVVLVGLAVERGLAFLLRRHLVRIDTMLATRLPLPAHEPDHDPVAAPPDTIAGPDGNGASAERARVQEAATRWRAARLLRQLRLLPWVLLRLVMELVPVAAFLGVATLMANVLAGPDDAVPAAQIMVMVINAYAIGRGVMVLLAALLSPRLPHLRPLPLDDGMARVLTGWTTALVVLPVAALCLADAGGLLGLSEPGQDAIGLVILLVEHLLVAGLILRVRHPVAHMLQPLGMARWRLGHGLFGGLAERWWIFALVLDLALWLVSAADIPGGYMRVWRLCAIAIGVLIVFRALAILLFGLLDRAFRPGQDAGNAASGLARRGARYYPYVRQALAWVLGIAGAVTLLQAWGVPAFDWFDDGKVGRRLVSAAATVLVALAIGIVVWEYVNAALDRQIGRYTSSAQPGRAMRLRTLSPILRTVLLVCLSIVVLMTVLSQIGLNIAPLLAGAGIIGVAVGFGSQKLVQDFITGIFLLLENAMEVGDWVTAGGLSGTVETLSIRTLRLRAGDGSVHIIPFSAVSTVTNINRGLGNAAVSVDIAPDQDIDRAAALLADIVQGMRQDPDLAPGMLSDLQYWGVNAVSSQAVTLLGQIVCTDAARWPVQRAFNRLLVQRFASEGIRLAQPAQSVELIAPPSKQADEAASESGAPPRAPAGGSPPAPP
ncbi:mechanosensitive ion channel domain-containing protein [Gluconacetobacter takamatsuzukensis]|uniref:Mechanosensitive ion channel n=1 Tax=Gluconacetobacter takamatsuzukensis TaxID=1286190 RepID=A0A7W4KFF5_9PROT|nr:mechanosensitive ion channel domain-containing protein [Gluconacetobacter takamatsuzukensis]MBB2205895.1 mechanosensitive ion channel [Gluconacetobacter takamatsuzukensis]